MYVRKKHRGPCNPCCHDSVSGGFMAMTMKYINMMFFENPDKVEHDREAK
jgi:hypothetical protein